MSCVLSSRKHESCCVLCTKGKMLLERYPDTLDVFALRIRLADSHGLLREL